MTDTDTINYRYPGPRPFGDNDYDRSLFFGREQETKKLLQLVATGKIVVLHSPPGMGKTSLINAGLNQKLRDVGFTPIPVRFTLPQLDQTGTPQPVLIIDAFEELFTLHPPQQAAAFTRQLADLVSGKNPGVKILIAIDDLFLGQLEETFGRDRGLLEDRLYLHGLDREQTIEAITAPTAVQVSHAVCFTFSEEATDTMADFLCNPRETSGFELALETQPFQLQLLCRTFEKAEGLKWVHAPHGVAAKDVKDEKKKRCEKRAQDVAPLLTLTANTYYERHLKQVHSWRRRRNARRLMETGLIRNGQRVCLEKKEIGMRFRVDGEVLDQLEQGALLQKESREDGLYYELSHGLLIEPVLAYRAKQRGQMLRTGSLLALLVLVILALSGVLSKIPGPWSPGRSSGEGVWVDSGQTISRSRSRTQMIVDGKRVSMWGSLRQGRKALVRKDYDEALNISNEILEKGFRHAALYHLMGMAHWEKGEADAAIANFQKALQYDSGLISSAMALGKVYERQKQFEKAIAVYRSALTHDRRNSELIKVLAVVLVRNRQPEEAIEVYRHAVSFNPNNATIYKEISRAMKEAGNTMQLETLFQLAAESKIQKPFHYFNLGSDLLEMKRPDQAEQYFKKAVDMLPGSALSHVRMGYEFIRLKRYRQALDLFEKATRLDPTEVRGFSSVGNAYYYMRKFDKAIEAYKRAADVAPGYQWNYYNMGLAYYRLENYRESAQAFQEYIALNPKSHAAYLLLGDAKSRLGKHEAALDAYREGVHLEPEGVAGNVRLGEAYWITGNYLGAIVQAEKVLKKSDLPPGDEGLMRFIESSGLMLTGKKREAVERLKDFARWYKSLKDITTVSFIHKKAHAVLKKSSRLEPDERRILQIMWNILASSRTEALEKLKRFEALIPAIVR